MKCLFNFLFLLIFALSHGQITFNTIPIDKQLIGRDLNTNLGHIIIEGEVNNSSVNYDSILIEVYRDGILNSSVSSVLNYNSGVALFNFDIPIVAELLNYSIRLYGQFGVTLTLEKVVDNIVAGDVFIIQGQSNAEAAKYNGSSNVNMNDFIRVYANGIESSSDLLNNNEWYFGQGDGYRNTNGNTGQWGLKLAKSIVESTNIPVAIFNGAHGGKQISFFQAPNDYKTSLLSNYSRLYYRLNVTGLKDYVRAVFWSQGEDDAAVTVATSTIEYQNKFNDLRNSWLTDYPNIEKTYIFQTKNACAQPIENLMAIKEAQRQLAINDDIDIMPTAAIIHHTDECHFPYINGYELFSNRIFPLVQRDLYNTSTPNEIDPPLITNAYLIDNTTLAVETDADNLLMPTIAENFELSNAGLAVITNIETSQNNIIFTLSENPGSNPEISYLAQYSGIGNFITNTNGLELICFYKYPINTSILSNSNIVIKDSIIAFPNPTNGLLHVKLPNTETKVKAKFFNYLGKLVYEKTFDSNTFQVNLQYDAGLYMLQIEGQNNIYFKKIIKQ